MDKETATEEGAEVKVIGNTERNSRMAELAAAARKERDDEIVAAGGAPIDTMNVEPSEESPAQEAVENPTPVAEEKAPEPVVEAKQEQKTEPETEFVTVKVDGREQRVPKEMVIDAGIRTFQKEAAADRRLEEATKLLREMQQAQEKLQSLPDMDEVELARRIRMGSDDEAVEAMRVIKGREVATPDQVATAVEARVMDKIHAQSAVEWFQSEYKDILSDPYLARLAMSEDERMLESGDTRGYRDRFKEIGDTLRAKVTEWKGGKAEVQVSTDKKDRKAQIINLPHASARKVEPEQPKPKTAADIIEEMRKRRGQAA